MAEVSTFDFDAFMAEKEKKGPTIKIFGKVEQLPPSLPAIVTVSTLRMLRSKSDVTQIEELLKMLHAIFGEERVESWMAQGLSMDGLEVLLERTIDLYNATKPSDKRRGGRK